MKGKVFLIHWNGAEAEHLAGGIRDQGWEIAGIEAKDGGRAYRLVGETSPDVIVIYLTRLPSHGRETAAYIRRRKTTRDIPIIFAGGEGTALAKTRDKVPAAIYTPAEGLYEALNGLVEDGGCF
jgi:CheY-like chemotaxis protein